MRNPPDNDTVNNSDDTIPVDAERFSTLFGNRKAKSFSTSKTDFIEVAVPVQSEADPYDNRYAVAWCFYAKGKPHKYTGRAADIGEYITRNGRPCLVSLSLGKGRNSWHFCNAPGLKVWKLPRRPTFDARVRRVGNNDRFLVTYSVNGSIIKAKRYRKMPQAFPRDFLHVVGLPQP